jgi:N-terminal domain of anti-restriction factor ArdC
MPHAAAAHKSLSDRASLYQEITDKIIRELEQGRVPWVQPWAGVSAPLGLPKNATSGKSAFAGGNEQLAGRPAGRTSQAAATGRRSLCLRPKHRPGCQGTGDAPSPAEMVVGTAQELAGMKLSREELLMRLGAAHKQGRTAWRQSRSLRTAPHSAIASIARSCAAPGGARAGYLLRTNLTDDDPARLWGFYLQLVSVEEATRHRPFPLLFPAPPTLSAGQPKPLPIRMYRHQRPSPVRAETAPPSGGKGSRLRAPRQRGRRARPEDKLPPGEGDAQTPGEKGDHRTAPA